MLKVWCWHGVHVPTSLSLQLEWREESLDIQHAAGIVPQLQCHTRLLLWQGKQCIYALLYWPCSHTCTVFGCTKNAEGRRNLIECGAHNRGTYMPSVDHVVGQTIPETLCFHSNFFFPFVDCVMLVWKEIPGSLSAFPYCKWQKAGRGLGTSLGHV